MKNKESIEATISESHRATRKAPNPRSLANLVAPWKPGQSGNPGGRVKDDIAAQLARAVFENNKELVYKSMAAMLSKGSAFGFQVLSDRAYGKVKESLEVDINTSEDLVNRLRAGMKRLAK